jgi:hypothetical protein
LTRNFSVRSYLLCHPPQVATQQERSSPRDHARSGAGGRRRISPGSRNDRTRHTRFTKMSASAGWPPGPAA